MPGSAGPRARSASPLDGLEARWGARWEESGVYRFDASRTRSQVFSIDTPPLTVSGSLHVGHVFSFTHTDVVARYRRMRGLEVFYPVGWDDNGLPTERRVEHVYGVRCDLAALYEPDFTPSQPPAARRADFVPVSRRNFVELCERQARLDERSYEEAWRLLGLSVDWSLRYTTIGRAAQRVSQAAFLRNLERGEAYAAEAPSLWDVTFRTAVAQAELEDRERPAAYHDLRFGTQDGEVLVATTRPELLVSCVALVAHPDDERFSALVGTTARAPVFGVEVPVLAHPLADPGKGTGIAMVCTFGDLTDVVWWRELDLPTRAVVDRAGRLAAQTPAWLPDEVSRAAYARLAGRSVHGAREETVRLLREAGALDGDPRPIMHAVKFYEQGDRPLEIVTARQWYLRNGGRSADLRTALLARGRELRWHPGFMRHRYEHWVEGLAGDWLVSRQRFFGVPIPLWYRLDAAGAPDHDAPIVPPMDALPVDPQAEVPPGYEAAQRDVPGGFTADPDVLDTWATSSLTPHIAAGWGSDADVFDRVFPMDLRPQAHEIIRTWLFATVVRSHLEHGVLPWSDAAISGWVVDPDRKKMSKSRGNVVVPLDLLTEYGADAVRYWAASARLGTDTTFDTGQMRIGRRLATKVLNASRFVLGLGEPDAGAPVLEPLDRAVLASLAPVVLAATDAFEAYDHARALELAEEAFWRFCDDYLELVKDRAYAPGAGASSARSTLRTGLSVLLRLLAPFLPYATEEAWNAGLGEGSIHRASWPAAQELLAWPDGSADGSGDPAVLDVAGGVLRAVRRAKSEAKVSMRAPVEEVRVHDVPERLAAVEAARSDLLAAGVVALLRTVPVDDAARAAVDVVLAGVAQDRAGLSAVSRRPRP